MAIKDTKIRICSIKEDINFLDHLLYFVLGAQPGNKLTEQHATPGACEGHNLFQVHWYEYRVQPINMSESASEKLSVQPSTDLTGPENLASSHNQESRILMYQT